jgi:spore coat polysaccharide biosynthesis predicted glycosyltransferase SpsG
LFKRGAAQEMIIFIPNNHGLGHYHRLLNIANNLKSYTSKKIGFYLVDSFEAGLKNVFEKCNRNDLKSAEVIVIDSNDREFNQIELVDVNCETIIWITDLQINLSGKYSKIFAPFSSYSNNKIMNGLDYFVVQKYESSISQAPPKMVNTIGIYFGSVDETNNLFFILQKLDSLELFDRYNFNVMVGSRYEYRKYIDEYFYEGYPESIQFHDSNFHSIYEFLSLNDVFMGCCGNTSFEALHIGIPIINIVQNQLQFRNAQMLQVRHGMPNMGFYPNDKAISELFNEGIFEDLPFYSNLAKTIVDGRASDRISTSILEELK